MGVGSTSLAGFLHRRNDAYRLGTVGTHTNRPRWIYFSIFAGGCRALLPDGLRALTPDRHRTALPDVPTVLCPSSTGRVLRGLRSDRVSGSLRRIGPIWRSLIPGREPDPKSRSSRLGPGVVTVWVLTTIPVLLFVYLLLILHIPRLLSRGSSPSASFTTLSSPPRGRLDRGGDRSDPPSFARPADGRRELLLLRTAKRIARCAVASPSERPGCGPRSPSRASSRSPWSPSPCAGQRLPAVGPKRPWNAVDATRTLARTPTIPIRTHSVAFALGIGGTRSRCGGDTTAGEPTTRKPTPARMSLPWRDRSRVFGCHARAFGRAVTLTATRNRCLTQREQPHPSAGLP